MLLAGVVIAAVLFVGIERSRIRALVEAPLLRSEFSHTDHRRTSCPECHHNFADDTGHSSCYHCHKQEMANGLARIDVMFHDFCMGCHRTERAQGREAGPVRTCSLCHTGEPPSVWR
jgi:Class III cytochrome C family